MYIPSVPIETLLSVLSILISVLTAIISLTYWLAKKFTEIDGRFRLMNERFESRFDSIDERFDKLERAFLQFADALLTVLGSKDVLTETEIFLLRSSVRSITPISRSKYYTEEVRKRLLELLDKDLKDYTLGDTEEMENIAELIWKEGYETKRKDLMDYSWKLRYLAMMIRAVCIYPKLYKQHLKDAPQK